MNASQTKVDWEAEARKIKLQKLEARKKAYYAAKRARKNKN